VKRLCDLHTRPPPTSNHHPLWTSYVILAASSSSPIAPPARRRRAPLLASAESAPATTSPAARAVTCLLSLVCLTCGSGESWHPSALLHSLTTSLSLLQYPSVVVTGTVAASFDRPNLPPSGASLASLAATVRIARGNSRRASARLLAEPATT
ncbi:hypothetical protein TOPH_06448, partial [Tolypocladium ophioglossoides CBS 100239]